MEKLQKKKWKWYVIGRDKKIVSRHKTYGQATKAIKSIDLTIMAAVDYDNR